MAEPEAPPEPHYIPPLIEETPIAAEQREAESRSLEAEIASFEFRPVQPERQTVEPGAPPASKPLIAELGEVPPALG